MPMKYIKCQEETIKVATYNKLIRDRIPQIIEEKGKEASTKILTNEEYIKEL
jgi:predicted house-cleaning noncanonical NTP pyrophosphatase (MazG superfamily)